MRLCAVLCVWGGEHGAFVFILFSFLALFFLLELMVDVLVVGHEANIFPVWVTGDGRAMCIGNFVVRWN